MSNIHAYEPKNGGGIFSFTMGPALPGRDPLTGWFVSSKEEDQLDSGHVEHFLDLSLETADECEARIYGESLDDPLTGGDGFSLYDSDRRFNQSSEDWDYWCEFFYLPYSTSPEYMAEVWVGWRFKQQFPELWEDEAADAADEIGEVYEHLPHRHGRLASFQAHPGYANACPEEYDTYYQSHGKRGRLNGEKLRAHRDIRRGRAHTNRQMDNIWMMDMTAEFYLDGFAEFDNADDHLDDVNRAIGHASEPDHKWFWDTAEGMFVMSEAHQNSHGFNACDPEDELMGEEDDSYLRRTGVGSAVWDGMDDYVEPMGGYRSGFYAWEIQAEIDYDEAAAEADWIERESQAEADRLHQEMADMGPTQEEWDAMDDVIRAEEADADAFEAQFEHVPMGNATGTKARLGHRVLLDA